MADLLLVLGLLVFRFGLGESGLDSALPAPAAIILSITFYGVFYSAMSLVIEDFADTKRQDPQQRVSVRLAIIAAITTLVGAILAVALHASLQPADTLVDSYGLGHLNRAQLADYAALALSVPLAALAAAISALLVEGLLRRRQHEPSSARAIGALVSAILVCGIGLAGEGLLRSFRAAELASYRDAFLGQRNREGRLSRHLLATDGAQVQDLGVRLLYISYDYQALCVPEARFARQYFAPPMALFDLRQSPLRTNPFEDPERDELDRVGHMTRVFIESGSRSGSGLTYAEFVEHVENLGRFDCGYFDAVTQFVQRNSKTEDR